MKTRPRSARGFGLAGSLAILLFAPTAHAYRPFDGTDADVAGLGEFELELGPVHFLHQGQQDFLIAPATTLNLGIAKRVELVADFKNFVALNDAGTQTGLRRLHLRDSDVLVKSVLRSGALQGGYGPSVALEAGALLPQSGTGGRLGAQADTIVSLAGPSTALHLNETLAGNRDHRFEVVSGAILEIARRHQVHPVAEVFFDEVVHGGYEASALLGAIWAHAESWVFDVAVRAARAGGESTVELRLGLTWTAQVWRPDAAE